MIGIYYIRHPCGIFYIGRTSNFRQRRNNHLSNLNRGTHGSEVLQEAYNILPEVTWEFISTIDVEDSIKLESQHILKNVGNSLMVNKLGNDYTLSPAHRAAISKFQTGRTPTEETLLKRSNSMKAVKRTEIWEARRTAALRDNPKLKQPRPNRCKSVSVDGVIYNSLTEVSATFNIDKSTAIGRINSTSEKFINWFYL